MQRAKVKNEIVLMRKLVKRVKVQAIRQMTRQVKKLRTKKGTEQQIEKNARRIERLLAELECIKDLVADDISRQAFFGKLSFDVKCQEDSPLNRATSRIIHHKIIQDRVQSLREQGILTNKLNLKEIEKTKRRKKKPTNVDLEINTSKDTFRSNDSVKDTEISDNKEEESSENEDRIDNNSDDEHDQNTEGDESDRDSDIDDDSGPQTEQEHDKILQGFQEKLTDTKIESVKESAVSDFCMRGSSSSDNDDDDDNYDTKSDCSGSDLDEVVRPTKITKKEKSNPVSNNKTKEKGQDKLKGMRGRREQLEENTRTAFRKRAAEAKAAVVDKPNNSATPTNVEKNILGISDLPPGMDTTLPDNIEGCVTEMKRPFSKQTVSRSSTVNKKPQKEGEKLHPSWEAKRKQKEKSTKIVPFQGKKITFDD